MTPIRVWPWDGEGVGSNMSSNTSKLGRDIREALIIAVDRKGRLQMARWNDPSRFRALNEHRVHEALSRRTSERESSAQRTDGMPY